MECCSLCFFIFLFACMFVTLQIHGPRTTDAICRAMRDTDYKAVQVGRNMGFYGQGTTHCQDGNNNNKKKKNNYRPILQYDDGSFLNAINLKHLCSVDLVSRMESQSRQQPVESRKKN